MAQIDGITVRRFNVSGVPTSLADLGYVRVGEDDGWELCGAGVNGSFHDANGHALINSTKFPDIKGLVDYAHSKVSGPDCKSVATPRPNEPHTTA